MFECPLFGRDEGQSGNLVQPCAPCAALALHTKNDVHDALHLSEALRVQVVGRLDVFLVGAGELEREACRCELNEPQAEVASVGIFVGLDVADAAVVVLKLTLNDKTGVIVPRQIKVVVAGGLAIERDLDVLVAGLSKSYAIGVESQWVWPSVRIIRSYR